MNEAAPALAYKLRVPDTTAHVRRPRLLERLENDVRRAPITWVAGLPGSGKTSLVARWVAESTRTPSWYRLDESDADPARLFDALDRDGRLPAWSPANQLDVTEFARAFFAEMATSPRVVVIDDCHRVADDASLLRVLGVAHEVCGDNLRFVVVSRRRPPPELARGIVGGWLALVDELRLDADESRAIAERVGGRVLSDDELHAADGWLAHLLALSHGGERRVDGASVGDFLATELLASLPVHLRDRLRHLAELPEIPDEVGEHLPPEIARLLATLSAQRYFVDRGVTYRLHDLLRDALQRLNANDPPTMLRAVQRALAEWIATRMPEAAMRLRVAAQDTSGAIALVEEHGDDWLLRGLHRALGEWLETLPPPTDPVELARWALWRGQALVPVEPEAARPLFAEARRAGIEARDVRTAYTAWCGEVSSYVIQWGAVQGLADLVDELEHLRATLGPERDDLVLRTASDALTALMYGGAEDPRITRFADATARAVTHEPDAGARISAAAQLLVYRLWWAGDFPGGRALYDTFDAEVSRGDGIAALPRLLWWSCASIVDWQCGSAAACYDKVDRGLALAASSGVHVRDFFLLTQGIFCALSQEDWPRAEAYLDQLSRTERQHRRLDTMVHYFFRSWYALCRNDARTALAHAEAAWPIAESIGSMFHKVIVLSALAPAQIAVGDIESAQASYRAQIALAKAARNPTFSFIAFCAGAEIGLVTGDVPETKKQVERMLLVKALGGFHSACGWRTPLMRDLLAFALRHDAHPEIARQWIRDKRIAPPSPAPAGWPTAVRIEARGGLRVVGLETRAGVKIARKLRELLAVLVVTRTGATQAQLIDWLWPEADGDRAAASLKAAVHRLRQWIGAEAVTVANGRTSLNAAVVSCDHWEQSIEPDALLVGFELPPVAALRGYR